MIESSTKGSLRTSCNAGNRPPSPDADRLTIFAFLWAAAVLVHHAAFPWWFDRQAFLNVALVACALVVLVRPRSIAAFAALAALGLLNVVKLAPFHPNHILFEGFVNAILLAALLLHLLRDTSGLSEGARREPLFDSFAAPIRIAYLLMFGFAVLHKLNLDYLAAEVSCAVAFLDTLPAQYGLPALGPSLREPMIWASLATEAAIPVGLLFARTRLLSVIAALLFHLLLSLSETVPRYSFAAEMFAVLFLFTPHAFAGTVSQTLNELRELKRRPFVRAAVALAACAAVVCLFHAETRRMLWSVWALALVAIFARCCRHCRGDFRIEDAFRVHPRFFWMFPVLVTVNRLSPYLGLKTETSFSMYSNLRTEGGRTNHLVFGRLDLADWQDDLVEIIDSDLPAFAQVRDEDVLLPYFEFQRTAGTADRDFRVDYRHNGEVRTLVVRDGLASDPVAATPPSWWLRKILRFRPVQREGATHCRH